MNKWMRASSAPRRTWTRQRDNERTNTKLSGFRLSVMCMCLSSGKTRRKRSARRMSDSVAIAEVQVTVNIKADHSQTQSLSMESLAAVIESSLSAWEKLLDSICYVFTLAISPLCILFSFLHLREFQSATSVWLRRPAPPSDAGDRQMCREFWSERSVAKPGRRRR